MQIAYWVVAGLLALIYLGTGGMKLFRTPAKLAESGLAWAADFPTWAVRSIGLLEVLGAAGLVLPALTAIASVLSPVAAVGLGVIQIGAVITHIVRGEAKVIPVNLLLLAGAVAAAWLGFLAWS